MATVLSYRLGGTDGVSVEAHKWAWALGELGFDVRRVAGEIAGRAARDDRVIPALAIEPAEGRRRPTPARSSAPSPAPSWSWSRTSARSL
ncbi:MAG: hypothetical protein M5U14_00250 [Acidimicrobiia bacterium]|nr:hypothetical protein [Acidimicrobiia bacterium]